MTVPPLRRCESTNVEAYGYDDDMMRLAVVFKSGGFYAYDDVTPEMVEALGVAKSKGRYLSHYVVTRPAQHRVTDLRKLGIEPVYA